VLDDEYKTSDKPLIVAGRMSHSDFEPSKIPLPNVLEILGMQKDK